MVKKLILAGIMATTGMAAHAADISSVDCTPPKVVITFASAVSVYDASDATAGLTSLKFKQSANSSNTVVMEPRSGTWDSDRDTFEIRPTRKNYEDTYSWNVWPVAVETTADGDTDTESCN